MRIDKPVNLLNETKTSKFANTFVKRNLIGPSDKETFSKKLFVKVDLFDLNKILRFNYITKDIDRVLTMLSLFIRQFSYQDKVTKFEILKFKICDDKVRTFSNLF